MSAILDALGYVGDSLDKPGRAVRGLLGGRPEEALAAVPFSDALGLTNHENRVSGSELLRQMGIDAGDGLGGTLAGMGVEMATDPLTWAGAGIGGLLGRRAGAAALARGPMYETTADDLARMVGRDANELAPNGILSTTPHSASPIELMDVSPPPTVRSLDDLQVRPMGKGYTIGDAARPELTPTEFQIAKILESPSRDAILREINPASLPLGAGAEGVAFQAPGGNVLRIGQLSPRDAGVGRLVDPEILQASRAVDFPGPLRNGSESIMRAERTPFAAGAGNPDVMTPEVLDGLTSRLGGRNIDFWDNHAGNAGMVGGRPMVIDPGAFMLGDMAGAAEPAFQRVAQGTHEPSALMRSLIYLGGGTTAARRAIEAGDNSLSLAYPLARFGGMGGAGVGAAGRPPSRGDQ